MGEGYWFQHSTWREAHTVNPDSHLSHLAGIHKDKIQHCHKAASPPGDAADGDAADALIFDNFFLAADLTAACLHQTPAWHWHPDFSDM